MTTLCLSDLVEDLNETVVWRKVVHYALDIGCTRKQARDAASYALTAGNNFEAVRLGTQRAMTLRRRDTHTEK